MKAKYLGRRVNPRAIESGQALVVNGRWAGLCHAQEVKTLSANQVLLRADGQVIALILESRDALTFLRVGCPALSGQILFLRRDRPRIAD